MTFLNLAKRRFSAKNFTNRQINRQDLEYILEAGIFAPSSYGLEPWKFVVFTRDECKKQVSEICFNQENAKTSSVIIAVMSKKSLSNEFVTKQMSRFGLDKDTTKNLVDGFFKSAKSEDFLAYTEKQCYFPALQMVLAAKDIGIDSCILGGFDRAKLDEYIKIDNFSTALVLALGYSESTPNRKKNRLEFKDVVDIR